MAEVNLAVASGPAGFNKLVVIKQLRQNLSDDPDFLNMFLDEARLAARLNHPNVVHTYEVVSDRQQNFIAMEYLDGQPLNRIVRDFSKAGGLPLEISLRIISDALGGLHYAHELADYDGTLLNVVHRDVSPHNIFVTYEGQTKVVDFGIAKALNSSSETRSGVIKG
ncbi:MAG: serine/threonine protein kinase, partial [Polyangiaceae bacterium]|nr:serine/threonine protein kinase [Polyangiaceae bacterium]